jgi:hypothetical protein
MRLERRQRPRSPLGFLRRDVTKVPLGIVLALILAVLVAIVLAS